MQELRNNFDSEDLKSVIFITNVLFYRLSSESMVLDTYDSNLEELLKKLRYVIIFGQLKDSFKIIFISSKWNGINLKK